MYRAVFVDSDSSFLERAERFLPRINRAIRVIPAVSVDEMSEVLKTRSVDAIVFRHEPELDLDGFSVFKDMLRRNDRRPFIMVASNSSEDTVVDALNLDVDYYLKRDRPAMEFFTDLADRIVLSVEKRRIEEERSLNERRLKALVRLANMYNHSFSEIAHYVLEESVKLTRSSMGYFALYDSETRKLTMYAWSQGGMKACNISEKPIVYDLDSTGIWGEPIRQRQAVIINDYSAPNHMKKGVPEGHVPMDRLLMIPMFYGGEVVGTAGVGNKEAPYDTNDLNQLTLLMEGLSSIYLGRLSERAMFETENRYEQIVDLAPVGILGVGSDGTISECNARMRDLLATTGLEDPIGMRLHDCPHEFCLQLTSLMDDVSKNGGEDMKELKAKIGGTLRTLLVGVRSHHDLDGRVVGTYVAVEDITDLKSSLAMLERAAYQINVVDRMMHQDVMSSVQTAKGYLGVMAGMTEDPGILDNVQRIEDLMSAIISQMNFSKEYKNVGVMNPEWQRPANLVEQARARLGIPREMLHISLGGLEMYADPALEKVFQHFLDNSIKHGGDVSSIEIRMVLEDGRISIIYKDDGVGIPREKRDRLFEKEFGRGFGMFLSKEILSMTGFIIRETGGPEGGARFEITGPPSNFRLYS